MSLELEVTPTVTAQIPLSENAGGLLDISAVGAVQLSVLSTNAVFTFNVATNTSQEVSFDGRGEEGLSLSVGADKDLDLFVYKLEEGSTEATLAYSVDNWLEYDPGGLLGSGAGWEADITPTYELSGGATYYVVVGNNGGLLDISVGTTITVETNTNTLTDYRAPSEVSGSVSGNVILGNGDGGADTVPVGTVVSMVDGASVTTGSQIVGDHGTLTINPDGSYSYEADPNFTGPYGAVDSFEYTIEAPSGATSTANLDISLDFDLNGDAEGSSASSAPPTAEEYVFGEGADVVSYDFLDGLGDTIENFNLAEGDAVDLSNLIPDATSETLDLYVSVEEVDGNTIISVDPDGESNLEALVTLIDIVHTLDELEDGILGSSVI